MRDEHFEIFVEEFGEVTTRVPASSSAINGWRSTMPSALLGYWSEEGWSGFGKGLFWIVNPDDFEDLLAEWLEGTPLAKVDHSTLSRVRLLASYTCGEKRQAPVQRL